MAKKVQAMVKLQIAAGKATPAPPVGTALGPHGVNIMDFCKAFNARTAKDEGLIIPAVVTIYSDRSYSFITKTPPASVLLKRAANLAKGSAEPNKNKVGTVTQKQVEDIAKLKMPDLNCGVDRGRGQDGRRHGAVDGTGCRRIKTCQLTSSKFKVVKFKVRSCGEAARTPNFELGNLELETDGEVTVGGAAGADKPR